MDFKLKGEEKSMKFEDLRD